MKSKNYRKYIIKEDIVLDKLDTKDPSPEYNAECLEKGIYIRSKGNDNYILFCTAKFDIYIELSYLNKILKMSRKKSSIIKQLNIFKLISSLFIKQV